VRYRWLLAISNLAVVIAIAALTPAEAMGQTAATRTATRTPWGDPDLQGTWDNKSITPLERPQELADKAFLTVAEAAELEKRTADNRADRPPREGDTGTYNQLWFDRGTSVVSTRRTSMIVDPPDGRKPPLSAEGQKKQAAIAAYVRANGLDGPEGLDVWDRCITRALPMFPAAYNNNFQILQAPGYVVILMEMIHDVRIIPLDGRPHISQEIRQWLGDSRGRWEGDTLVVDTTNFSEKTHGMLGGGLTAGFSGLGETLRLIERFTRVADDSILYEVTVDDPTFTKPWTAAMPVSKTDGLIFEYACHEGNYALPGILGGARAQEKAAAETAKKGSN
jgi:hypothetical protein